MRASIASGGTSPRSPRVGQTKGSAVPDFPAAFQAGQTVGRKSMKSGRCNFFAVSSPCSAGAMTSPSLTVSIRSRM